MFVVVATAFTTMLFTFMSMGKIKAFTEGGYPGNTYLTLKQYVATVN